MAMEEFEGIGPAHAATLEAAGITSAATLLAAAGTRAGRAKLVEQTGISAKLILDWVNHADLMRIDGVGYQYADLLEAAGVDSPAELAQRNAANLAITFQELNAARPTVQRIPSEEMVTEWIAAAKKLPSAVEH